MKQVLALVLAVTAGPAVAETARVLSGEHDDFTRLVIEMPTGADWTVGRTATGYGFAAGAGAQPAFDLSRTWDRIPRDRLQAIRTDPGTGALLISLACPCHVFPFEYQPGMVVLDIREGPAPAGSVFEAPFAMLPDEVAGGKPALAPAVAGYDWLDPELPVPGTGAATDLPLPALNEAARIDPLREALLMLISRGAADGLVDMHLPAAPATNEGSEQPPEGVAIRLGELPGLSVGGVDPVPGTPPACLPDTDIAIADWGAGRPPLDLLAEARDGLYGEFDDLQPDAVLRAMRLHVYLGFGAEALQYAALAPDMPRDRAMTALLSIARLMDGESDPGTPFADMLGCDGAAALWSALAHDRLPTAAEVNTDAIVRSFQALPAHLRRQLGPPLADRLLDRDPEAARIIRDSVARTPDMPVGTVALIDAKVALAEGNPDAALSHAETAVASGTITPHGLIALVEAHFQSSLPLSEDVAATLRSLVREAEPSEDQAALHRALVLALALSGQLDEAFAIADPVAPETPDLWQTLAERADDTAFLAHAVRNPDTLVPPVSPAVSLALGGRLADLGFAEAALQWLGSVGVSADPQRRLAAARAELLRGDARQALVHLAGLDGSDAAALRARAQTQLGALQDAQRTLRDAGEAEMASRLDIWRQDWAALATDGTDPWVLAAGYAATPAPQGAGQLAEGQALLDDSAAARAAVSALLAGIPATAP
jgi:hypothetical protein